jgi:hypothetical protein
VIGGRGVGAFGGSRLHRGGPRAGGGHVFYPRFVAGGVHSGAVTRGFKVDVAAA